MKKNKKNAVALLLLPLAMSVCFDWHFVGNGSLFNLLHTLANRFVGYIFWFLVLRSRDFTLASNKRCFLIPQILSR